MSTNNIRCHEFPNLGADEKNATKRQAWTTSIHEGLLLPEGLRPSDEICLNSPEYNCTLVKVFMLIRPLVNRGEKTHRYQLILGADIVRLL